MLFINPPLSREPFSFVSPDYYGNFRLAVDALLRRGHRRIVYPKTAYDTPDCHARLRAYRDAHASAGLPVDEELIYCKHDGSLDDGFEIVTHPMSLDWHLHQMPWEAILNKAVQMGYLSHRANTCGLHVHVSRDAFGFTREGQDCAISRALYFVEKHWNELLRFSRRTQRQLDRWAARYGYKDDPQEHIKKGYGSRYTCVNLTNEETIEFRIFRGTLKYNTLIATLQMVNHICDAAICLSDEQLKALSWSEFVSGITEPELIRYLKERRLYLNEPVESEADL